MGEFVPGAGHTHEANLPTMHASPNFRRQSDSTAFHSQLEYLNQHQLHPPPNAGHYAQQAFDMGALAGALPQSMQSPLDPQSQYGSADAPGMLSPATVYQMQQASQHAMGRGLQVDPAAAARSQQQQQYMNSSYGSLLHQSSMLSKQPMQMQGSYNQFDPYAYGLGPGQVPMLDPRFAPQSPFGIPPNMAGDLSQYPRRASEPAPIPSYPRGPPRKPKQSGHALWVGNLPPAATVGDLKDHFSRDATKDIESLFLISKSNCAFVNYRSESACIAAMNRFHDSRFHGVRLVCRLRRGAPTGSSPSTMTAPDLSETPSRNPSPAGPATPATIEEHPSPTIVGSSISLTNPAQASATSGTGDTVRVPEKYFVVKSLTIQDLEASVRNGIWATQSHNESILNGAYDAADNVYLVFSANKSGEYFGYARMASKIEGDPVNLSSTVAPEEPRSTGAPQSIPTEATETAPRGRIIDDSARGTIFWEAEHSDDDDNESPEKGSSEGLSGQNWGRQFSIEWLSTSRLPFYRTRGLRNPWNANREVKIARDGTELEPNVGRRLVQMFHRPTQGLVQSQAGLPFR